MPSFEASVTQFFFSFHIRKERMYSILAKLDKIESLLAEPRYGSTRARTKFAPDSAVEIVATRKNPDSNYEVIYLVSWKSAPHDATEYTWETLENIANLQNGEKLWTEYLETLKRNSDTTKLSDVDQRRMLEAYAEKLGISKLEAIQINDKSVYVPSKRKTLDVNEERECSSTFLKKDREKLSTPVKKQLDKLDNNKKRYIESTNYCIDDDKEECTYKVDCQHIFNFTYDESTKTVNFETPRWISKEYLLARAYVAYTWDCTVKDDDGETRGTNKITGLGEKNKYEAIIDLAVQ